MVTHKGNPKYNATRALSLQPQDTTQQGRTGENKYAKTLTFKSAISIHDK